MPTIRLPGGVLARDRTFGALRRARKRPTLLHVVSAIRFQRTGGPEVLELGQVEVPEPRTGEALVRHTFIGVNFIDTYHRSGLYSVAGLPSGIGVEAAGVVERIGAEVHDIRVGDRVAYASGQPGAYAEARVIAADRLVPLPSDIPDEVAAAGLLKGMTVEFLIRRTYAVKAGQTVLWHAAAGGVGLIASQWLKALGARVIGTAGSETKAALARRHGCEDVIQYTREDFPKRVRELTNGKGVPVVYDSVGKATFEGSLDCLEPRGLLVSFGNASGPPPPLEVGLLARKGSLYVTRPTLLTYTKERAELLESAAALFAMIRSASVKIEIGQRFSLADAAAAHRALEARSTLGSTLLTL